MSITSRSAAESSRIFRRGRVLDFEQRKVNDEVWLPALLEGRGEARALLLFKFDGSLRAVESDYRKFRATSTILPGMSYG